MLDPLFDHGAMLPRDPRRAVQVALGKNEMGVIELLLDKGLEPRFLSREDDKGCSPVHTAFRIALRGEESKFNCFLLYCT